MYVSKNIVYWAFGSIIILLILLFASIGYIIHTGKSDNNDLVKRLESIQSQSERTTAAIESATAINQSNIELTQSIRDRLDAAAADASESTDIIGTASDTNNVISERNSELINLTEQLRDSLERSQTILSKNNGSISTSEQGSEKAK